MKQTINLCNLGTHSKVEIAPSRLGGTAIADAPGSMLKFKQGRTVIKFGKPVGHR